MQALSTQLLGRRDAVFAVGFAILYAVAATAYPSYFSLLEPDSSTYLEFSPVRTSLYPLFLWACGSLGAGPQQIAYVQVLLFAGALIPFTAAMQRIGIPRLFVVAVVLALAANVQFSSLHRTILSESLFLTLSVLCLSFWLDYFRTGRLRHLVCVALFLGLMIGVRPAGAALVAALVLSVWLKWPQRNVSAFVLFAAALAALVVGPLIERIGYRVVHGDQRQSVSSYLWMGKAAMLVHDGTVYTGPHAATLNALGAKLNDTFKPVHRFLDNVPSFAGRAVLTAGYEVAADFYVLGPELDEAARQSGVAVSTLRTELGQQALPQNWGGYVRLTLTHYAGQWMVGALKFPSVADALNQYVSRQASVPLERLVGDQLLRPVPARSSIVVFPLFIVCGVVTFLLSCVLVVFLVRPARAGSVRGFHLMLAAFFAASCHGYTLAVSMVNLSTPRFLMAVFPQLVLALIFALLAIVPALSDDRSRRAA